MTKKRKFIFVSFLCCIYVASLQGQSTIPATGGNATGSGGSVSYTAGQATYQTSEGTTGTVAQGVQQPYEISMENYTPAVYFLQVIKKQSGIKSI